MFQVGEVAQLRRYLPTQLVTIEDQPSLQVGEVAQLRRYLPAQLVTLEVAACFRLVRLPNSAGMGPLNWLLQRPSSLQVGEVAQLRRYLPAQLVA